MSNQQVVLPVIAWFGRCPGERPCADAFVIDLEQIGKAPDGPVGVRQQSRLAVQQVLCSVVGGIAHKGLGVDREPLLAPCPNDVARVQVGGQHDAAWRVSRQFVERAAGPRARGRRRASARLTPASPRSNAPASWRAAGRRAAHRWPPHAREEPRDNAILLALGLASQPGPRLAPFEQHRPELIVGLEQPHDGVAVPEPQALNLVLALHVRHAELQNGREFRRRALPAPPTRSWSRRCRTGRPPPATIAPAGRQWRAEAERATRRARAPSRKPPPIGLVSSPSWPSLFASCRQSSPGLRPRRLCCWCRATPSGSRSDEHVPTCTPFRHRCRPGRPGSEHRAAGRCRRPADQ